MMKAYRSIISHNKRLIALMPTISKDLRRMLGLSLHGWENAMVVFLIVAGLFALIAGVATWAVVQLQRVEIAASEQELTKYKLDTAKEIAEANARTSEAALKLEQLRRLSGPRDINFNEFQKQLANKPKAPVVIWYLPDSSDGYWFASRLFVALGALKWQVESPKPIPDLDEKVVETIMPSSASLLSILRSMPKAINAGGQPSGITVVSDGVDAEISENTPYSALFNALAKSVPFGMYGSGGSQFMPVPKGTLRVVIAAKSEPIFADSPVNTESAVSK